MSPDELNIEARARIIWGEEPSSVHAYLTSNGMSPADADRKIQELVDERNKEMRRIGVRGICIGAAILIVIGVLILVGFSRPPSKLFPTAWGEFIICITPVGLYGIWKLINGLFHLLRPRTETRSIPDMTE